MKVFFTGSPRALKTLREEHEAVYQIIEKYGGHHLSDLVVKAEPEEFYQANHAEVVKHYNKTIGFVKRADIVVAEVSVHSMSIGFLINKALEYNKPTIALYKKGNKPFFLSGIENEKLIVREYTPQNIEQVLKEALDQAQEVSDTRFNFYVSPEISRYLDWVNQNKKLPRAVFLRTLLEKAMKSDKDFEK